MRATPMKALLSRLVRHLARASQKPDTASAGFARVGQPGGARLTAAQLSILRRGGTERPFTSPLNAERRPGSYRCAACDAALFRSEAKFDSGTGWPSFRAALPGALGYREDFTLLMQRIEYHCARCGGHHGHVFDDGPPPTGKRYCSNGTVLRFVPDNDRA